MPRPISIKWHVNELMTGWIAREFPGCTLTHMQEVPLSWIDEKRSRDNPGRLDRPVLDHVIDSMLMEAAKRDEYPLDCLIVWFPEEGQPGITLDGLHRYIFLKLMKVPFCEIVKVSGIGPLTANAITYGLNPFNGTGQTGEEKYYRGYHVVRAGTETGTTIKEVAAKYNLNVKTLGHHVGGYNLERLWKYEWKVRGIDISHGAYCVLTPFYVDPESKRTTFSHSEPVSRRVASLLASAGRIEVGVAERFMQAIRAVKSKGDSAIIATAEAWVTGFIDECKNRPARPRNRPANKQATIVGMATRLFNKLEELDGPQLFDVLEDPYYRRCLADRLEQIAVVGKGIVDAIRAQG
jgi:hypothetical protein